MSPLVAQAGQLTSLDGVASAREKLTLLVLADWELSLRSVDLFDLALQTIQSHHELKFTLRSLARKGFLDFGGFGLDKHSAPVMVDVVLHLPEVTE